jgi:general secretion pathway protein K
MEQLVWLGLPAATVRALQPYATLLPVATTTNLNTASAEVLHAALPNFDMARARQLVAQRATGHFKTVTDAFKAGGIRDGGEGQAQSKDFSVNSHYFGIRGRLRLGDGAVQELSLVERSGTLVKVIWRQREALASVTTASLQ